VICVNKVFITRVSPLTFRTSKQDVISHTLKDQGESYHPRQIEKLRSSTRTARSKQVVYFSMEYSWT